MKKYYAFFDVDGTILQKTSMIGFLEFYYQKKLHSAWLGKIAVKLFLYKSRFLLNIGKTREYLNKQYYHCFKDQTMDGLDNIGAQWFLNEIEKNSSALHTNVVKELRHHQNLGGEVVFVSGSFRSCLRPIANKFDVKTILASELVENNKYLTGEIILPPTIGEGKSKKIQQFLSTKNYDELRDCYAYGDHESDIPMLSLVGNPVVIAGDKVLENYAKNKGWRIIQPN